MAPTGRASLDHADTAQLGAQEEAVPDNPTSTVPAEETTSPRTGLTEVAAGSDQDAYLAQCIAHLQRHWPAVIPILENHEQYIGQAPMFEWTPCQYFSGISDFGWKSDPFSFSHVFPLAKTCFWKPPGSSSYTSPSEVRNTVSWTLPKCSRLSTA